jgi:hypothetical protein
MTNRCLLEKSEETMSSKNKDEKALFHKSTKINSMILKTALSKSQEV